MVACATVASATIYKLLTYERFVMSKFMKMLNNICRSQAIYRHSRVSAPDLQTGHYAYVLAICREPGRSQEEIAQELCLNKSTVARSVNYLEGKGYVLRNPLPSDKRQFALCPTEKALAVLPEIKKASAEWREFLSEGITQEEFDVFDSVLERMQARAREIVRRVEEDK